MWMDELVKTFRHFLVRDAIYIVGGGLVITSFLYRFCQLPPLDLNWQLAPSLLAAGIAYVIGHAIQDGVSLTRLTTTAWLLKPNWGVRKLYWLLERREWEEPSPPFKNLKELERAAFQIQSDEAKAELQRIISLMMIGTTMAPCFLISSLFVIWPPGRACGVTEVGFDRALATAGICFSALLWAPGWIKNAQRTLFVATHAKRLEASAGD